MGRVLSCRVGAVATLTVVLSLAASTAGQACTSGVLQIKEFPHTDYDSCFVGPPSANSIKAVCNSAIRVTVKDGIIRLVPIETGTFNYSGPGPFVNPNVADCSTFNASGLVSASGTAATVMLYDNFGGPLSNLTRNGTYITLSPGLTYSYKSPAVPCYYNYAVVSGCVLGLKAPAKPPPCPRGFATKTGRFGLKYCAPCLHGTFAAKPNSKKCSICPRGTVNTQLGAYRCTKCTEQGYQPRRGKTFCDYCSSYDNKWTDNVAKCKTCPAGSTVSAAKPKQCVRCYAGKKCCTVNDGKDCPKCTNAATAPTYTSIFALESATPPSCMASAYALCAPKINITIDGTCTITMDNLQNQVNPANDIFCQWSTTSAIRGPVIDPIKDFNFRSFDDNVSLYAANATLFKAPYIDFSIPRIKCTLRYRALTAPAAKVLGAAPKPATTATCPPGKYIDTSADAKPAPCLPCPPGSYSSKAGTTGACTPCAAGTYANRFGSKKCKKCPAGLVSKRGSGTCLVCDDSNSIVVKGDCQRCPDKSYAFFKGVPACLGNAAGTTCCAAGDCKGQTPCSGDRTGNEETYGAILQLVSKKVSAPGCNKAALLSTCLAPGDKVLAKTYSTGGGFDLTPEAIFCRGNASITTYTYYGGVAGTNRAFVTGYDFFGFGGVAYEVRSKKGTSTITITLVNDWDGLNYDRVTRGLKLTKCSATFKLLAGYTLDAAPPAGAKCPGAYSTFTANGRSLCTFCGSGSYRNTTGGCSLCPAGTSQGSNAATSCKTCPAGYSCYEGAYQPQLCGPGTYAAKPRSSDCAQCKPNTFASGLKPASKCTPCPKGTIAPEAAGACGVPWETVFA